MPRPVLERYHAWQLEAERQPVEFYARRSATLLAESRAALAERIGCAGDDLVYVTNATVGVNVVARSLQLGSGDEVLATDHEYGACDRMWRFLCQKSGASYRHVTLPAPIETAEAVVEALFSQVSAATRVLFVSHITAPTAVTLPVEQICRRARSQGIVTVIDGAHVPGQVDLDLRAVGADFYTGNLHKWLCAPKGAAFLYARPDAQRMLEPLVVSWGWEAEEGYPAESTFIAHHEYRGTRDIAAALTVPAAWEFYDRHRWPEVRVRCHRMLQDARPEIARLLEAEAPAADDAFYAQMCAFVLPRDVDGAALKQWLYDEHLVEVPVFKWNDRQTLRVSVQGYTSQSEIDRLIDALALWRSSKRG